MLNAYAPPFKLVGAYFLFGIFYLVFGIYGLCFIKNDIYDFTFVAFVHTFLLGFVINIIIGALYQLTSVILEKHFFSIKGAFLNCIVQNLSILVLVCGFFISDINFMFYGGIVLICTILYFDSLFLLTFIKDFKPKFSSISLMIGGFSLAFSMFYACGLLLFFCKGFLIDYDLFLRLHVYFALGFVFFISVGVASVLVPMFTLVHNAKFILSKGSVILYLFALVFMFFKVWYFVVFALILFTLESAYIVYKRVRKARDFYVLNLYLAYFGVVLVIFGFLQKDMVSSIFYLFFGVLLPFILAHLYKILPFLIWYHYISKFVGKVKVPLLNDMVLKNIAYICLCFNALALFFIAINYMQIAFVCLVICSVCILINIFNFFKYTKFKG